MTDRESPPIRMGESEGKSFYEIISASYPFGWRTFDHACTEAWEKGTISEENALLYCTKRGVVTRAIDNIKKTRGENTTDIASLKMQHNEIPKAAEPAATGRKSLRIK